MIGKIVFIVVLAVGLFAMAAGATEPKWMQTKAKELVDKARVETKHITIQELKKAIDDEGEVVVLDVRTPKEYEAAHIPEAINAPRDLLEFLGITGELHAPDSRVCSSPVKISGQYCIK